MNKKKHDVYEPIGQEEGDLMKSTEADEWTEVSDVDLQKNRAREYAEATVRKDKRMNIRISERDLRNLKRRALEEGIPYQTMVSMILHKYLTGRFAERTIKKS